MNQPSLTTVTLTTNYETSIQNKHASSTLNVEQSENVIIHSMQSFDMENYSEIVKLIVNEWRRHTKPSLDAIQIKALDQVTISVSTDLFEPGYDLGEAHDMTQMKSLLTSLDIVDEIFHEHTFKLQMTIKQRRGKPSVNAHYQLSLISTTDPLLNLRDQVGKVVYEFIQKDA